MREEVANNWVQVFEYSAVWYLEKIEWGEDLTDEEDRNVATFRLLEQSVKDVPPTLLHDISGFEAKSPELFDQSLDSLVLSVSDQFRPVTATEFLGELNARLRAKLEAALA